MSDFKESLIATIRSISGNESLQLQDSVLEDVNFRNLHLNQLYQNYNVRLPEISEDNLSRSRIRAFADLAAIYVRFHNSEIYQKYSFDDAQKQNLFSNFEKLRLVLKGGLIFKGVATNLTSLIAQEFNSLDNLESEEFLPYLLLEQIAPYLLKYQDLSNIFLRNKVSDLGKLIDDQEDFSILCRDIIELIFAKDKDDNLVQQNNENIQQKEDLSAPQNKEQSNNQNDNKIEQKKELQLVKSKQGKKADSGKMAMSLEKAPKITEEKGFDEIVHNDFVINPVHPYSVFTTKYDKIVKAKDLATGEELSKLRGQLDIKLSKLQKISRHLTNKLQRKLLTKKDVTYKFNKEEGVIDRKKMVQMVTKPMLSAKYMTVNESVYQDTAVTLLLDNSGSMRGNPITMSALACEIIASILERFAIKSEILGFTTVNWRGGNSRKDWEAAERPKNPGRLSDLCHIIYKNANQTFKKSRQNLGLMLKEGILKENIDGEALIWASTRLIKLNQQRKILIIISDGTPIDDSTNSNNDDNILLNHLHQIVSKIEKHSEIELAAIGIGHDISNIYQNAITIQNLNELGDVMIDKICDLL